MTWKRQIMTRKRLIPILILKFIVGSLSVRVVHTFYKRESEYLGYPVYFYTFFKGESQDVGFPGLYAPPSGNPLSWKTFDKYGIVMADYRLIFGKQYNPITISQYALANFNYYVSTGKKQLKEEFLKHADWLVEHQVITPNAFGVWRYNFNWEAYQCHAPWISAMAQGQAISVLVRAYVLTNEKSYLETARFALGAFEHSVDEGGVRFTDLDGNIFYLEYACESHPCVLNGFIFSLYGLYDYYQITGSQNALSLFDDGIRTLKVRLKDYDTSDWSYYDLLGRKASEAYHRLHCQLLFKLYSITGERQFLDYAEKWYSYLEK